MKRGRNSGRREPRSQRVHGDKYADKPRGQWGRYANRDAALAALAARFNEGEHHA